MHLLQRILQLTLLASAITSVSGASSWGFSDATVSVQRKGAGVGNAVQEKLNENRPLSKPLSLGDAETLKLALTTKEGSSAKRPHQAFLLLKDSKSGLDYSYPLSVKDSGKAKVEISQKELPLQFLSAVHPLDAEIVIGSFGSSKGYHKTAFQLKVLHESNQPVKEMEFERYGKQPEIHHIFKQGPSSPPIMIPALFVLAVVAPLPMLFSSWSLLGANLNHVSLALKSAPLAHAVFVGSVLGMEGIFFMYYTSWNLFQTLPPAVLVGATAYVSGSRALSEVQERRLAGLR